MQIGHLPCHDGPQTEKTSPLCENRALGLDFPPYERSRPTMIAPVTPWTIGRYAADIYCREKLDLSSGTVENL